MYMLIRVDTSTFHDIPDDKEFFTKLLCEESISCLPASVRPSAAPDDFYPPLR